MGMFSTKEKSKVQSTVLNLAGDIGNRPNFLKTVIFDQTMHKLKPTYSAAITSAYLNGQGIKLRRVVPFARRTEYYNLTGQNRARVTTAGSIDINLLTDILSFRFQKAISVTEADIDTSILYWWVDRWLIENHPSLYGSEYDAYIDDDGLVTIDFDKTGLKLTFTPTDYVYGAEYLYVTYRTDLQEAGDPLVVYGPTTEVVNFPSMLDWTEVSNNLVDSEFHFVETTNVSRDFTDGKFEEDDPVINELVETHETNHIHYNKVINVTGGTITYDSYHDDTYKLEPTKTEVKTTYPDYVETTVVNSFNVVPVKTTKTDAINTTMFGKGPTQIFIYRLGSGDGQLDGLFTQSQDGGEYFPFIPLKTDLKPGVKARQVYVDNSTFPELYEANIAMMRKVAGSNKYDEILDSLEENSGSDKINYAYVFFGTSINTPDTSAMVYIHKYFKAMLGSGTGDPAYLTFKDAWNRAEQSVKDWNDWYLAQSDPDSPFFGLVEPGILPYPTAPTTSVRIRSNNTFNMQYTLSWNGLKITRGTGRATPTIKTHYAELKKGTASNMEQTGLLGGRFNHLLPASLNPAGDEIIIYYQIDDDTWESVHVYGLTSLNMIYDGKGVYIKAYDQIGEKDESGLLIPLNDAVFRSMPLIAATQMTTGCMYMMINTYTAWEKKYYQTDWFKVIVIVIVIVLTVFSGGAAAPLSGTVGGTAAATIGLTGIAATIFALAVNAIAGLIISRILTAAATALFGDEIGMIIGAIASMVAMNAMNSYAAGTQFNVMDAFNGDNLLKLTSTIASDFGKMYAEETANIISESEKMFQEYKEQSDILQDAYNTEFGNRAMLDPLKFLEAPKQLYFEKSEAFLQRTLMTGSEISGLSMDAIAMLTDIGTQVNLQ